jgi:hypothetical protein
VRAVKRASGCRFVIGTGPGGILLCRGRDRLEHAIRDARHSDGHGRAESAPLRRNGFYLRQSTTAGSFLGREEIEARDPRRTTDLVQGVRSTRVQPSGPTGILLRQRRADRMCVVHVFIDGLPAEHDLNYLHPDQLQAIELYQGDEVPLRFRRVTSGRAPCGAMVVWTRSEQ